MQFDAYARSTFSPEKNLSTQSALPCWDFRTEGSLVYQPSKMVQSNEQRRTSSPPQLRFIRPA